jgi:RHS repeat-associated protein
LHTYSWDADGNTLNFDLNKTTAVAVTYDALGRAVEQNRGGTYSQIVYAPNGSKLAVMNGQTLQSAFIALPGGATAVYNSSGLAYYRHPDWLGSSRIASTPDNQVYASQSYAPFGEAYVEAGRTDRSFAGHDEDTITGIYDAPFRKYNPYQGRWISPDPGGLSVVDLADPQSWNRYAYVLNSPINLIDPLGLWCTWTITFSADGENATNTLMCGDDRGGRVGAGNHGNTPMLPGDLGGEAGGGDVGVGGPANNGNSIAAPHPPAKLPAKPASWWSRYMTQLSCEASVTIADMSDEEDYFKGSGTVLAIGLAGNSLTLGLAGDALVGTAVVGNAFHARSICVPIAWGN